MCSVMVLFFVCAFLPFGSDYKGCWIFVLAPAQALGPFARGVYALLWLGGIVLPHLLALPLFAWFWGVFHALLFTGYGITAASLFLAFELRLIQGAPFSRQVDSTRNAVMPLVAIGGGSGNHNSDGRAIRCVPSAGGNSGGDSGARHWRVSS